MRLNSITDIGARRKENQDNYWSALLNIDGTEAGVICLCDGMGGLNDGGLASKMVVEAVRDSILSGVEFSELIETLNQANSSIYELGQKSMGTTCTLLFCMGNQYEIYHIGDSRCYIGSGKELIQITTDHSFLEKYKNSVNPEELPKKLWNKYRSCLTKCIGVKQDAEFDYYNGTYKDGDIFFVCSDGMWHYLDSEKVLNCEAVNLEELVKECIEKGETDNITAGILYV